MTPEKTIEVFGELRALILRVEDVDTRGDRPPLRSARFSSVMMDLKQRGEIPDYVVAEHLLYMCDEGARFVREGRAEKAMRWLGFLQGVVWSRGHASLDELKRMNMPEGAAD